MRGIVGLCHALDPEVVAEGVEHAQHQTLLAGLGCDRLQGHHIGRPAYEEDEPAAEAV